MPFLPKLQNIQKQSVVQQEFRGLNHNEFTEDAEFYNDLNMSSQYYPYASPRANRGSFVDSNGKPFGSYTYESGKTVYNNGIATKQGFCFVEGNRFYYKSNEDNIYHDIGAVEDSEKQFVSLGAYILIFPDKKYFWSAMYLHYDDEEWLKEHGLEQSAFFGDLEALVESQGSSIRMNVCDVYGEDYEFQFIQKEFPDESKVKNGDKWLDISSSPAKIMQYSESYSGWVEIVSNYIKVTFNNDLTQFFNDWDGVTLNGFPSTLQAFNSATVLYMVGKNDNGTSYIVIPGIITPQTVISDNIIYNTSGTKANTIEYYFKLYKQTITETDSEDRVKSTENYFTEETLSNKVYTSTHTDDGFTSAVTTDTTVEEISKDKISIHRKIPDMDFVAELDNRLWGCSNENHEIYASKPGDPFNFNFYLGGASDSYVLTIGSDGDFTGAISHLGYMLFFKENTIHKIYGTKPSNFQLTSLSARGVEKGSHKSLCVVNETLFYKSDTGIMMFQGSLPENISDELGAEKYSNAVAGACNNRFYISMLNNSTKKWQLFTYDTVFGLWHKEDETRFISVLNTPNNIYYIDQNYEMKSVLPSDEVFKVKRLVDVDKYVETEYSNIPESNFEWEFETGDLYNGSIDNKYISKLRVLFTITQNSRITFYVKYDNNEWNMLASKTYQYTNSSRDTHNIPLLVKRARRMRLKISGTGACLIQAIAMEVEKGSER